MSRRIAAQYSNLLGSYLLGLSLLGTCLTPCAAQSAGDRLERLPTIHPDRPHALQADRGDSITFAAGAVRLTAPDQWWVQEFPRGREVRLVLSPEEVGRRIPRDSIWLCYHAHEPNQLTPEDELQTLLAKRLSLSTDPSATVSTLEVVQLGPWVAVSQEFVYADSQGEDVSTKGRHVLVRTDWGIFEIHASAPAEQFEARTAEWKQVWESLQLEAPVQLSPEAATPVPEARAILGSWKSYRSRMRLRPDGTISIVPDSVNLLTSAATPNVLEGTFEAKGDLLFVTWRDGSLLNLRWRSRGSDLFLTDHEGQITQLKRLLE